MNQQKTKAFLSAAVTFLIWLIIPHARAISPSPLWSLSQVPTVLFPMPALSKAAMVTSMARPSPVAHATNARRSESARTAPSRHSTLSPAVVRGSCLLGVYAELELGGGPFIPTAIHDQPRCQRRCLDRFSRPHHRNQCQRDRLRHHRPDRQRFYRVVLLP